MAGYGRPKGSPKVGGRKKGTPNKRTTYKRIAQENAVLRALKHGTTPLDVMQIVMLGGEQAKKIDDRQLKAATDLARFVHAPLSPQPAPMPSEKQKTVIVVEGGLPDNGTNFDSSSTNVSPGSGERLRLSREVQGDQMRETLGEDRVWEDDSE